MPALRLFPLVAFAALCLLALKSVGMLTGQGFALTGSASAVASDATTQPTASAGRSDKPEEVEGAGELPIAVGEASSGELDKTAGKPKRDAESPLVRGRQSSAHQALLKSLTGRRSALDKRDRELDLRENLLKAAEKRLEARIKELKSLDVRIQAALAKQDEIQGQQFDRLVKIYTQMKPKDAARIFNRLDPEVLVGLVGRMKPDSMSAILGRMHPEVAKGLTAELAARATSRSATNATLPKIGAGN